MSNPIKLVDRVLNRVAVLDRAVARVAVRLLPVRKASGCYGIYCGTFCAHPASFCYPTYPGDVVDAYTLDSWNCASPDCYHWYGYCCSP